MKQNFLKSFALFILVLSVGLFSCNRVINDNNTVVLPDPGNSVMKINVVGQVIDNNQQPVSNATARIGNKTVQTNSDGYFFVRNVELKGPYGFVKVEKGGFFTGSRTFKMQDKETHYVHIQLLPKTARGVFNAAVGGSVSFDGFTVTIPAHAVKNASGAPYTGQVTVAGQYLNPNDPNLSLIMPGDLLSKNQYNVPELIKTFGMAGVELVGSQGEALQITPGFEAIVEFPVQSNQVGNAPTEIPLWHFDETNGFWMKEGSATLQNGKYVGKVKHFSFWNCDTPEAANITLEMTLVDASGNPLPNLQVELTSSNYGTRSGITNSSGWVGGLIPNNEVLAMSVYMPVQGISCQLLMQNIGPFTVNTNLGNITITNSGNIVITTVSGIVQDCNMIPVTNGIAMMSVGGYNSYDLTDANGAYSFSHITCITGGVSADLFAQDLTAFTQGSTSTITLNGGAISQNLSSCGAVIPEYISHSENGVPFMFTNPLTISCTDSIGGTSLQVSANNFGAGSQQQLNFTLNDLGGGSYSVTNFFGYGFTGVQTTLYTVNTVTVSNYPALTGQYLDCVITGTFLSPPAATLPFTTTVHILKD